MKAAKYVGGDFYDYFKIDGTRLGIVIGDVSGKGVPAAIFMAISRTILRTIALSCPSCADCLRQANEILSSTGHIKYSNAGHNPPIVIRRTDGSTTTLEPTGDIALGAVPGITYSEKETVLAPGDSLLLYTDGVTEAMNSAGEFFGSSRLLEICSGSSTDDSPEALLAMIGDSMTAFTAGASQSDDITLLAVTFR